MPSPFPGMNPYLEQADEWHGFHKWFCPRFADALVAATPPRYVIKLGENVYLRGPSSGARRLIGRPDTALVEDRQGSVPRGTVTAEAASPPVYARLPAFDLEKLSFIEIRDARSRRLITAIELLIPATKQPGNDRDQSLAKRARLMSEVVNLVEIDLLRGGPRMPMEGVPDCDYLVMVARPVEWPRAGVWPINLRDPLPDVPIPLGEGDPDLRIGLQPLIHAIYDAGGYGQFIYDGQPEPPLSPADAEWARGLVPTR